MSFWDFANNGTGIIFDDLLHATPPTGSTPASASSALDPTVKAMADGLYKAGTITPYSAAVAAAESMIHGPQKGSSSSSSSSSSPSPGTPNQTTPTIAQMVFGAAQQSGQGFASSGFLPNWVLSSAAQQTETGKRILGGRSYGVKSNDSLLVYLGRAPDVKSKKVITDTGGPRPQGGEAPDPSSTVKTTTKHGGDKLVTLTQAMNAPFGWDPKEVQSAIAQFQKAGFSNVTDFDSLTSAWGGVVTRAAMTYTLSGGDKKVSPWDVLNLYKQEAPKPSNVYGSATFTGSHTTTSRSVNDLTEGEAWSVLQSQMQQMLGHDPSDSEMRDYVYRMNQLAARNPSVTKTIQQYRNGAPTDSSSTTTGGFTASDAQQAAYNKAQNDPGYAEYQSASTYFNAALSALGPIGNVSSTA